MKKCLFILCVGMLSVAVSCKDLLAKYPADQVSSEEMWTTESLAEQGINGLYTNFYASNVTSALVNFSSGNADGIDRWHWMMMEFQSFQYFGIGCDMLTQATKSGSDFAISYEWKWCYTGIHQVNDAIVNLSRAGLDTEKYERFMCEARFLRAYYYLRLFKIFQEVPIYLEPISNEECTKGCSSGQEVLDVVFDDLTYCIENEYMPDNTLTSDYGRPSKGAAYSLRGEAYMWQAWLNNEDEASYQLAANDFEKVSGCGYGLWQGDYIDFFHHSNERDHEMIWPLQFNPDKGGYSDVLQLELGINAADGWSYIRPSYDFVTYFQNADGSTFYWTQRIPEWNDAVFGDVSKREVFFLRDSIYLDSNNKVLGTVNNVKYWDETQVGKLQERVNAIGVSNFNKYYLPEGNEDRIRAAYNNRDPRLKEIVLVPYDPYDCYSSSRNNGNRMYGLELRWPVLFTKGTDGDDIKIGDDPTSMHAYKKWVYTTKEDLVSNVLYDTDWPLIRYTDVYLHLAECYTHLGRLSDAVGIVNEIRARAGMPDVSVGTASQVLEAVKYERRVELCLEGQSFFDDWRWGDYYKMKFQYNEKYGNQSFWGEWNGYKTTWYYKDNMYPYGPPADEVHRNPNIKAKYGWSY